MSNTLRMHFLAGSLCLICLSPSWAANGSAQDSGAFSGATSGSIANGIIASGLLTSAAVAIPLIATGELVGAAAANSAEVTGVGHTTRKSLAITEETLSVMPPNQALAPTAPNPAR